MNQEALRQIWDTVIPQIKMHGCKITTKFGAEIEIKDITENMEIAKFLEKIILERVRNI